VHSQSDFFQHPQNRLSRRANIQSQKPAAFLAELHTGIQADTSLVDEEAQQLAILLILGFVFHPNR
jgi:hypothetical protein